MTTTSKHTPGPWTLEAGSNGLRTNVVLVNHPTHTSCTVCSIEPEDDNGAAIRMAQANARLIAAAPDLVEALQAMLIVHDHGECEAMHPDTAERMARDALAKAGVQS